MKISVITNSKGWHIDDLENAAKDLNVSIEFVDFTSIQDFYAKQISLGEVVLWRSSSLKSNIAKNSVCKAISTHRILINKGYANFPNISYKLFQQATYRNIANSRGIETFTANDYSALEQLTKSNKLRFPFIAKPDLGSKGKGVELISDLAQTKELNFDHLIFQNFVPNDSDFRVFIIGGRVISIMQRIRSKGFLNNISQGAKGVALEKNELYFELSQIGLEAASIFNLNICGVDIIQNSETKELKFMEVNTAPQWQGIQSVFPNIHFAKEIVSYCKLLSERTSVFDAVQNYYDKSLEYIPRKAFHFSSRMYLWTLDDKYKNILELEENASIKVKDESDIKKEFEYILSKSTYRPSKYQAIREDSLKKYPLIRNYNEILFSALFAKTIYSRDLSKNVLEVIGKKKLEDIFNKLINDPESIMKLSTVAINFLYLSKEFLNIDLKPQLFFEIAKRYQNEIDSELLIYLLTHTIIGASKFYSQKILADKELYIECLKYLEEIFLNNFVNISLDTKLEFLVCCRILEYQSLIEKSINSEAEKSLSDLGNYVVDKFNSKETNTKDDMEKAEHRNVLFLMSKMQPHFLSIPA